MNTKRALTISFLAIILTGLTAGIVNYIKKTGNNPLKIQEAKADADYQIGEINNTTSTFYITNSTASTQDNATLELTYTKTENTTTFTGQFFINKIDGKSIIGSYTENLNTTLNNTDATYIEFIRNSYLITGSTNPRNIIATYSFYIRNENDQPIYTKIIQLQKTINATGNTANTIATTLWITDLTITNSIIEYGQTNYNTGYSEGVAYGYDATSMNNAIDIRGLMLNILTMPFTFITQAFDVVFWEGTAYEFHLASFIKGLIAIGAILFIIRLFTSGFSIIGNYTAKTHNKVNKSKPTKSKKE